MIGFRPELWNQDLLTSESDKYGATGITLGLTVLAQINGGDELSISDKTKFVGENIEELRSGREIGMCIKYFLVNLHVFDMD